MFEIRENNHCGGVIFQAGNPESMLKNLPSAVIISSYVYVGLECDLSGHQIQWRDIKSSTTIENFFTPYDGIPHITVGHYVLHCEFGSDTSYTQKEKRRRKKGIFNIMCYTVNLEVIQVIRRRRNEGKKRYF